MRITLALPLISLGLVACEAPAAEGEADGTASTPPAVEGPIPVEPDGGIGDGAGPPDAPSTTEDPDGVGEPSAYAQTFPVAIQGTWRATDGDAITRAECDNALPDNLGSVLTIREDSYTYFEQGGRLIEVSKREPGSLRAVFDTTYADEPTRDEMEFEVDPVAKTLTVRNLDTGERSTTTYRRCPR